jgi:hypothetical protein
MVYMKKIIVLIALLFCASAYAGDYHQRTQGHRVAYVVADSSGNPVTGETIRLQVQRVSDDAVLDFSDNSFKFSGWTTRYATMTYNAQGEYYTRTVSVDSTRFVSGDYVCIVSNDSSTYGDQQVETFTVDSLGDLIKVSR